MNILLVNLVIILQKIRLTGRLPVKMVAQADVARLFAQPHENHN